MAVHDGADPETAATHLMLGPDVSLPELRDAQGRVLRPAGRGYHFSGSQAPGGPTQIRLDCYDGSGGPGRSCT